MRIAMNIRTALAAIITMLLLQACGSGSGASVVQNPLTSTPEVSNYNGPPPATPDVQTFKLAVWDNLVPNNRCGNCHEGSQNPRFVRADDINLAYDEANTIVDLSDPAASIIVNKVRGGHNCWLPDANACGDIVQSYIENWAGASLGGASKEVELVAPTNLAMPGNSKNFPEDSALFASTIYPLLTDYCAGCHTDSAAIPQSPFFASSELAVAYEAAKAKIDLDTPVNSRFVLRLGSEFHNCWTDCPNNANEMRDAIIDFSDGIDETEVDPQLVTSMAMSLPQGIISSAGGRFETNAIALYEFKTGNGNLVYDTSGVEPSLNLTLSGDYRWVGGWGVQFLAGKAQGSTTASSKLFDLIRSTGEFSVEAWVAPANVTQDGPARIVSYSGGPMTRNLMLGQTLYDYDSFVRSSETDQAGEPALSTPAADEVLQATLQHVVMNYDPINGRQIFVNGELIDSMDSVPGGLLNEWDDTFALALGSEVDNNNRWAGTVRLLAIHNRVLTPEQITQNFEVGVGEKYYLLFNVTSHVGITDAYVVFEVSQFDSYAYLFDEPFFIVLNDAGVTIGDIALQGMRLGLNGRELAVGQAFGNIDLTINDVDYAVNGLQQLSELGTIIALEKGPDEDEFFLTFERLGDATNVVTEPVPVAPPPPPDVPRDPMVGIRDFAEVHYTMAKLTGVPVSHSEVAETYNRVYQAMPVQTKIGGFISSQQMGITQLAIEYCSVLIDEPARRSAFFPDFDFTAGPGAAFADRSEVIDPLIDNMVGRNIATQPEITELTNEVNALIDRLIPGGQTTSIMKGACASVLGSAAMLVQ